jgi:hypothetical protein
LAFCGWRSTSSFWWCVVPANDDRPAAMALLDRDLDVVRRVGVHHVNRGALKQAIQVRGLAAVAAQQAVLAEDPDVARLSGRLVGRLGDVVGVSQPVGVRRLEQAQ